MQARPMESGRNRRRDRGTACFAECQHVRARRSPTGGSRRVYLRRPPLLIRIEILPMRCFSLSRLAMVMST